MAGQGFLANVSGMIKEILGIQTSAGAGDAGKIPALNSAGNIDVTMLPPGVGPEVVSVPCSEDLSAGNFVNLYNNGGTVNCRKADASAANAGKRAHGFVLSGYINGQTALVYLPGQLNNQLSSLTIGVTQYLSGSTPGAATNVAPSTSGYTVQELGVSQSATVIPFHPGTPIVLA